MMANAKVILIFLFLINAVMTKEPGAPTSVPDPKPSTSKQQGPTVCAPSLTAGEMATCAGTALTRNRISYTQFEDYLHQALSKIPSDRTFYAIGWQSSSDPGVVLSSQSHYSFDWSKRIPLDPRELYQIPEIVLAAPVDRPTLLYSFSKEMLEEAGMLHRSPYHIKGGSMIKNLYKFQDTVEPVQENPKENCVAYTAWLDKEDVRGKKGLVVLADAKYWCPRLALVHFEVVIGHFRKVKESYHSEWEIGSNHQMGGVPMWAQQVFP